MKPRASLLAFASLVAMRVHPVAAETPPPPPATPPPPSATVEAPPAYAPAPPAYVTPYPYAPLPPPPPLDAHTHTGFFLRMSLGLGYMGDHVTLTDAGYAGEVTTKGPAAAFEIDVGGSIVPGFSLSGAFLLHAMGDSTLSDDSRTFTATGSTAGTPTRLEQTPQLSMLGVMADVYPNPRKGFHAGGALGFASIQTRRGDNGDGASGGFGIAPHAGYEWWVADYWGLGVLGRLLYARTRSPYADGRQTDRVFTFTVAFSATYN